MLDCVARVWGRIDTMQDYFFWVVAGAFAVLALVAGFGEHRRRKRRDFDAVGYVPWTLLQILALFAAVGAAMVALHN